MRQVSRRGVVLVGLISLLLLLGFAPAARHVRAVQFLSRLSEPASAAASPKIRTEDVSIPGATGNIRARLYFREGTKPGPGMVVAHGVHYRGIDERRLVPFARALAESGLTVLTPELREIADYRITRAGVEVIGDSVRYLAARRDLVSEDKVELLGFSFAGGLSLVAAGEPETARHLSSVTSVGGHHDLERVLSFLIHDPKAHEYGLVVLLYGNLEHFVPAADVSALRAALQAWLQEDRNKARELAKAATTPEAEKLWQMLEKQQLQTLAPALDRLLEAQRAELKALSSAGRLQQLSMPVYLLHGSHDSVIPPSETDGAARELAGADHQALISPLLEHVEVSKTASLADKLALVSFMAKLL